MTPSKVKVGQANVTALLDHLKDLGIPQSATLIALGSKVYKALEGNLPSRLSSQPINALFRDERSLAL
ncbi:hypothetical protein QY886_10805 [Latilactobacillus sakei]